jgi:hypothetical protein
MAGKVPSTYLVAYGRTPDYFRTIQRGTAPTRFTTEFLENLGFKSKNDRAVVPLLKSLNFLDDANAPTQAYRDYLDPGRGKAVLGRQILRAYEGIFELNRDAHKEKASSLVGLFKSLANVSDPVANWMAQTFANLCALADIDGARSPDKPTQEMAKETGEVKPIERGQLGEFGGIAGLSYHIEIHLPNTTDVEVFRAIFKALREHLVR